MQGLAENTSYVASFIMPGNRICLQRGNERLLEELSVLCTSDVVLVKLLGEGLVSLEELQHLL